MSSNRGSISDQDMEGVRTFSEIFQNQTGESFPYPVWRRILLNLPRHSYEKDCDGKLPSNDEEYEKLISSLRRKIVNARSSKLFYERERSEYDKDLDFDKDPETIKSKIEEWDTKHKKHLECLKLLKKDYTEGTKRRNNRQGTKRSRSRNNNRDTSKRVASGKRTKHKNRNKSKSKNRNKSKRIKK